MPKSVTFGSMLFATWVCASMLDRENGNLGSIQRILGHENGTTTEIYLESIGDAEREAMKIFERVG